MARTTQTLGERIHSARARKRLTQGQLATLAGLTQPHVSRYERGERVPSVGHLASIARVLGCTVDDLLPRRAAS